MTIIRLLTEKRRRRDWREPREGNQTADRVIGTEPITRLREAERRVILIVCSPDENVLPSDGSKGKEKKTKEMKERAVGIGLALEPRFDADIVTTHVCF